MDSKEKVEKAKAILLAKKQQREQQEAENLVQSPIERAKELLKNYDKNIQKKLVNNPQ